MERILDAATLAVLRVIGEALEGGSVNVFDREFRYVFAEGEGLDNVGLSPDLLIGRTLFEVFGADESARVIPYYSRAFAGERVSFDLDTAGRTFNLTAAPLSTTRPETIIVLVEDVTLHRAQIAEHNRRTTLVATVAHELRQPLSALRPALELLKEENRSERAQRLTELIDRQVYSLERLVADLGSVREQSGSGLELNLHETDLMQVLRDAANGLRPRLEMREQTLVVEPCDALPMRGDEVRLRQVFSNLLMNAVTYTPAKGRISLQCTQAEEHAVVRVSDTGQGISPELLPHIFSAFVRGENGGMGIGLNVVRQLVEAHGGRVAAQSEGPGRGSTFTVTLPLASGVDAAAAGASELKGN